MKNLCKILDFDFELFNTVDACVLTATLWFSVDMTFIFRIMLAVNFIV